MKSQLIHLSPLVALAALIAGCPAPREKPVDLGHTGPQPYEPMASREYRLAIQEMGTLPNTGLLLPAISPDGQWVAFVDGPERQPADDHAMLAGGGVAGNRLVLRAAKGGQTKTLSPGGTAWIAWSSDSRTLAFVAYSPERCELGIHDVAGGQTRKLALGPKHLAMPAFSPSGGKIAMVDCDGLPGSCRIYILELAGGKLDPGPDLPAGHRQLWPLWLDEQALVYLDWGEDSSQFAKWSPGNGPGRPVCQTGPLRDWGQALQVLVPIQQPLSDDRGRLAYYEPSEDRVMLVRLAAAVVVEGGQAGRVQPLGEKTRCGCWSGSAFAAANDKALLLYDPGDKEGRRLLSGTFLPLRGGAEPGRLFVCAPATDEMSFVLKSLRFQERE